MPILPRTPEPKRHILTVALEDYFQVGAFHRMISRGQWYRFETRLEHNTRRVLELLDRHELKATFFVLGWIADRYPELVRQVAERGHEVASKGYYHRGLEQMSPEEFRDELLRSREALERASGRKVLGFRVSDGWFRSADLWALDVLAELGFAYDSSIAPIGRRFAGQSWRLLAHEHSGPHGRIWELPISGTGWLGWRVPIAGGNWFRQLPQSFLRRAIDRWDRRQSAPLVLYFHAWELDPEQPRISASSWLTHLRHYRNLDRMEQFLEYYFERYRFTTAADYLELDTTLDRPVTQGPAHEDEPLLRFPRRDRAPVTVVIPCYNEQQTLPYLNNTLVSVERKLGVDYDLSFVMVDDGSKDATWAELQRLFGGRPNFNLVQHTRNQGVAAAILTGIRQAKTEIVCSMDADCTYDPHELANMIPLLTPGVDLVTASPYHPDGAVRNVPRWRLGLSKGASWLYRRVLHQKLGTYTSCFRVYRRQAVENLSVRETGFLGVAELLGILDLNGGKIVEHPAVLEVRMMGRSKMKTVRTIFGHLKLMARLFAMRLNGPALPQPVAVKPDETEPQASRLRLRKPS
jgi:polysaccharide deacetylase family protein (PEP-CTERM system associated)